MLYEVITKVLVENAVQVEKGQKLAEWDPFTMPIVTEREGIATYADVIEGVSMKEVMDDATGMVSRVVIDTKQQSRGVDLKPRIVLTDEKGEIFTLANGQEARYFLSADSRNNFV